MQLLVKTVKGDQYSVECEPVRRPAPWVRVSVGVSVSVRAGFARACRPSHRSLREPRQADSVLAVKEKLASQHSVAEAALQKLLFSGRVLADSVTLGEAGIKQAASELTLTLT